LLTSFAKKFKEIFSNRARLTAISEDVMFAPYTTIINPAYNNDAKQSDASFSFIPVTLSLSKDHLNKTTELQLIISPLG
jgi:hypothetical protein